MKKREFKIGDRVAVYCGEDRFTGRVQDVFENQTVSIDRPGYPYGCPVVHFKQCRRLKPRAKPREWWINEANFKKRSVMKNAHVGWHEWFESSKGSLIRTTRPENTKGWICVREARKAVSK